MSNNILEQIVAKRIKSVDIARSKISLKNLSKKCQHLPETISLYKKIRNSSQTALIAEMKRSSPSAGVLDSQLDPSERTEIYCKAGASAISVLTEQDYFKGSINDLKIASKIAHTYNIPVLRKDFIIDEYQIYEARASGADAILLIIGILDEESYQFFYNLSHDLQMDVLVEVFDDSELEKALKLSPKLIGVNNRNLKTLETNLSVFENLSKKIPSSILKVAESGMKSIEDIKKMSDIGADAVLVGEALMKSDSTFEMISKITKKHD